MKFRDFIREEKEKHAVLAFGRMNPPTTGHEVLVNKVKEVARQNNASHHVVLSHSQDKAKNPLTPSQKALHARRFFPGTNITLATKEHPNFLTQAQKLHQKGVTHLHMVAGSDRVPEYDKLLKKYNGTHEGALFNFKSIKVHNAGERDPDADDTSGMSASKMRGHAAASNFKEFKKGIPSHVPEHHARELYDHVRRGMGIRENMDFTLPMDEEVAQLLYEGVHDKGIFKAVFLAGGPGSGKDYVLDNTLAGHGLTEINSDKALEFLMDKHGLDKTMPPSEQEKRDYIRGRAKNITELRQRLALLGRNGLIINGTGDDVEKYKKIKERLEEIGYETSMVSVVTDDEVSRQRNIERGQRGGRSVPEEIRKAKWDAVTKARAEMAKMFGDNYVEFDNSQDLRTADPETVKAKKDEMLGIFKRVKSFVETPPSTEKSQAWVAQELSKKDNTLVSDEDAEKHPHPDNESSQQARQLGLTYYGFGRWGKNGEVTHHSVHGQLVAIQKEKIKDVSVPIDGSSQKPPVTVKKVTAKNATMKTESLDHEFESFLTEAVTITVKADTAEEAAKAVKLLSNEPDEQEEVEEEVQDGFSDLTAKQLLTLNQTFGVQAESKDNKKHIFPSEHLLKDSNGKVRVFMMRRAAAAEAHQKGGQVQKSGNGYVVKLKEDTHVTSVNQSVQEKTTTSAGSTVQSGSGTTSSGSLITESRDSGCGCGCGGAEASCQEKGTGKKKTIAEVKASWSKEKAVKESIDKGIEPGLSMATSGENLVRGATKNKPKEKPLEEMQGDETTASIGDQKEDELKKKGISLSSFKKRNYV